MAETAVGVFNQMYAADLVSEALRGDGISADAIRLVSKSAGVVDSSSSTPSIDFGAALAQNLHSMGATEEESEAYVASVQRGGVLMFVTGTREQADHAASLMDAHGAGQIEEFAGSVPMLPGIQVGEIGANSISFKEDRSRARESGARVFTW